MRSWCTQRKRNGTHTSPRTTTGNTFHLSFSRTDSETQYLWVSESLKSMPWSKEKQSTAITSAVCSSTPLLQEKSCAEGRSYLKGDYCQNWQRLVQPQLPPGGPAGTCVRPGRGLSYCWARQPQMGTRQGGKSVSEITKALHPELASRICSTTLHAGRHVHFQRQASNLKQKLSPLIHWMALYCNVAAEFLTDNKIQIMPIPIEVKEMWTHF